MAKLTIEIDMDDTQESWEALYRRIEESSDADEKPQSPPKTPSTSPATYDLLLDPERAFGEVGDIFAILSGHD
jgi:hypothetical protein